MRRLRLVLLADAAVTGLLVPTAAQAAPIVTQPFYADSGDACPYGYTRGVLGWQLGVPPSYRLTVVVSGSVVDRPLPADPTNACPDDARYSIATFSAYAGSALVGQEARRVENGELSFKFTLGVNSNFAAIDRVTVQVCRPSTLPGPVPDVYCGKPQEYRAPATIDG